MWERYGELAAQYYLAGRSSAALGHVPSCANQLHLCFELLLKGGLIKAGVASEQSDVDDFLKETYGHRLRTLWRDFKGTYGLSDTDDFDAAHPGRQHLGHPD